MLISEAIDELLAQTENVTFAEASHDQRRARAQNYLRQSVGNVWYERSWSFKRRTAQLTIPALAGQIELPEDFDSTGPYGGVYLTSTGKRLAYVDPQYLQQIKRQPGHTISDPGIYSIYDVAAAEPYEQLLQIETNSGSVVLDVSYEASPPDLDETTNDDGLNLIPPGYHRTVILAEAASLIRLSVGDVTFAQWEAQHRRGTKMMAGNLRPGRDTAARLSGAFGR